MESGVACIDFELDNPIELFRSWFDEVNKLNNTHPARALCLSTVSEKGRVSSRNLLMRKLDCDGFVIVTDSRSRKCQDIKYNNRAAANFLWCYRNDNKQIMRQVRWEGHLTELAPNEIKPIYDDEPFYCKIRAHACVQDEKIGWYEQKSRHDQVVEDYNSKRNNLEMPDHYVGYKFIPNFMDFYHAYNHFYADRLEFSKDEEGVWSKVRVSA